MPLVTTKELLEKAMRGKYAVGAFNANNIEMVQAIIEAAEEENAPVILQASQGAIKYAGLENIAAIVKNAAAMAKIPIALHLDHGTDYEQNVKCFRIGFTSLMFDGSKLPYEENVSITRKIVEMGHAVGVPVEGEIGKIAGTEDHITVSEVEADMTEPEEALRFVADTGVDSLAVAVGSVHRMKKKEAKLDHERIKKIAELVKIPLVLHGSSGVMDDEMRKGIKEGLCKINVATQLNMVFVEGMRKALNEKPEEVDPRKILGVSKELLKKVVRDRIRVFGCSGKA
ncbi:class II fructose-1,6-bisphosphate aldolase [bacterium]|nr:class II fructose-1,6-bisphosphate aldolase [bacterium]